VCCRLQVAPSGESYMEVSASLAESNGSLLPGLCRDLLHVTCRLTACTPGSAPGPTLGNEYGKTLPFTVSHMAPAALCFRVVCPCVCQDGGILRLSCHQLLVRLCCSCVNSDGSKLILLTSRQSVEFLT